MGFEMNATNLTDAEKAKVLREAYRKLAQSLHDIEETQVKLTAVLLAILGAGATFIAGARQPSSLGARVGLTVVIIATVVIGSISTHFRNRARKATRYLLVRCEKALGFYDVGVYIRDEVLYAPEPNVTAAKLDEFSKKGNWLAYINWLVVAVGIGFLLVLWLDLIATL
jgi:hypothetical protein